jgi:acetylornithine deacetylase/succinyl-diaminopimelate desuccinylase-like protein
MPERVLARPLITALAAQAQIARAIDWLDGAEEFLAEETIRVTEIPAPTFAEGERAAYVAERLRALGLERVELTASGNVYALVGGSIGEPRVALYAHLDTVFGADVAVGVSRRGGRLFAPGVGDNAAGVAGTLGALRALREAGLELERPVWVVATVGEEGLGDLNGARAATDRLGADLDAVVAVEGSFFGRVSHTAVGSRRWRVTMTGPGGHSWHDFGRTSAVHALVRAAAAITRLEVPAEPRTSFNIGSIRGGTGVNVIAEQAELILDMRSADRAQLDRLGGRIRRILDDARDEGVTVEVTEVGDRPSGHIATSHPLVQTCVAILGHLGVSPVYASASTDANIPLSRGIPAVTLGVTRGGGAHTLGEWIDTAPMVRGTQQLVLLLAALTSAQTERALHHLT